MRRRGQKIIGQWVIVEVPGRHGRKVTHYVEINYRVVTLLSPWGHITTNLFTYLWMVIWMSCVGISSMIMSRQSILHDVYDPLWGNYRSGSTSINNLWMFAFHHTQVSLKGLQHTLIHEGKSPPAMELTCGDIRRCGVLLRLVLAHQRVFPALTDFDTNEVLCPDPELWQRWGWMDHLTLILQLYLQCTVMCFSFTIFFCLLPSVHTVSTAIFFF